MGLPTPSIAPILPLLMPPSPVYNENGFNIYNNFKQPFNKVSAPNAKT